MMSFDYQHQLLAIIANSIVADSIPGIILEPFLLPVKAG
jgi:hypothetical protein